MKIQTQRFESSGFTGEVVFQLPAGAVVVDVRTSRMGESDLVYTVADTAPTKVEQVALMFLWEGPDLAAGGEQEKWRHVGAIAFPSGAVQHVFAPVLRKKSA